jgi:hypothetical protein
LQLSFRRALLAVVVYFIVMTGAQIGMILIGHYGVPQVRHG